MAKSRSTGSRSDGPVWDLDPSDASGKVRRPASVYPMAATVATRWNRPSRASGFSLDLAADDLEEREEERREGAPDLEPEPVLGLPQDHRFHALEDGACPPSDRPHREVERAQGGKCVEHGRSAHLDADLAMADVHEAMRRIGELRREA